MIAADGHLGIWAALGEQQPTAAEQHCWIHLIVIELDAMPKKVQTEAWSPSTNDAVSRN
jgi:transposase-like protein